MKNEYFLRQAKMECIASRLCLARNIVRSSSERRRWPETSGASRGKSESGRCTQRTGRDLSKTEGGHSGLVGGVLASKGTCTRGLSWAPQEEMFAPPARILKVRIVALMRSRARSGWFLNLSRCSVKAASLILTPTVGMVDRACGPRTG